MISVSKGESNYPHNKQTEFLRQTIHNIRNSQIMNIHTLQKMNDLSQDDRLKILCTYNEMIEYYANILEENE